MILGWSPELTSHALLTGGGMTDQSRALAPWLDAFVTGGPRLHSGRAEPEANNGIDTELYLIRPYVDESARMTALPGVGDGRAAPPVPGVAVPQEGNP